MAEEEPLEGQEHETETHEAGEQENKGDKGKGLEGEEHESEENNPRLQALLKREWEKREIAERDWLKSDLAKGIPHVGLAGGRPRHLSDPPPFEISPEDRIKFLQSCLDGEFKFNRSADQEANIHRLIEAYSKGELGPMSTYPKHSYAAVCNGKIFDHYPTEEEREGHDVWTEVRFATVKGAVLILSASANFNRLKEFGYQMMQGGKVCTSSTDAGRIYLGRNTSS